MKTDNQNRLHISAAQTNQLHAPDRARRFQDVEAARPTDTAVTSTAAGRFKKGVLAAVALGGTLLGGGLAAAVALPLLKQQQGGHALTPFHPVMPRYTAPHPISSRKLEQLEQAFTLQPGEWSPDLDPVSRPTETPVAPSNHDKAAAARRHKGSASSAALATSSPPPKLSAAGQEVDESAPSLPHRPAAAQLQLEALSLPRRPAAAQQQVEAPSPPHRPAAAQQQVEALTPAVAGSRHKFGLFVAYAWNPEVFTVALRSYQNSGWGDRLIVVDNSRQQDLAERQLVPAGVEILPTHVQLTFSQVQNFMMRTAQHRDYDFYLWGHSDVVALSSSPQMRFADEALASLDLLIEREPQWGVAFFSQRPLESDWLSAVRTRMTRELQYDTAITVYRSDCDFYPRVRAAGWRTLPVPEFKGKLYDMNRPLSLTFESWDVLKGELEQFNSTVDPETRNNWKESAFDLDEHMGMQVFQQASNHYFNLKWGTLDCDLIDGGNPRGGAGLRSKPWQDLLAQSQPQADEETPLDA